MDIDVAKMLCRKYPRMSRLLPQGVIELLRRVLHEEEINSIIEQYRHLAPTDFLRGVLSWFDVDYRLHGRQHLPASGRCVFVANHPFGGMDGVMAADALARRYGDVRVVVNDMLMHISPLVPLWLPVNKFGSQHQPNAVRYDAAFASDVPILTFPAGRCSRLVGGAVDDEQWRRSYLRRAIDTRRAVVPIYISGRLSPRFYAICRLRKALHIAAHIEMLWLVDEMFLQRGRRFDMVFGRAIEPRELLAVGNYDNQNDYVRRKTYALSKQLIYDTTDFCPRK